MTKDKLEYEILRICHRRWLRPCDVSAAINVTSNRVRMTMLILSRAGFLRRNQVSTVKTYYRTAAPK